MSLYLNSIVNDMCLAEDIMQETFVKLAIKKPAFRGKCSFKTWLSTI
ncbi:RNA polymerase sigma factor [Ruminococcus flavefaciens]|nr:sigma factor [Ruminococcus flavefaciens]